MWAVASILNVVSIKRTIQRVTLIAAIGGQFFVIGLSVIVIVLGLKNGLPWLVLAGTAAAAVALRIVWTFSRVLRSLK